MRGVRHEARHYRNALISRSGVPQAQFMVRTPTGLFDMNRPSLLLLLCALWGCELARSSAGSLAVVDSAGVVIMIHKGQTGRQLAVAEDPDLVIGRGGEHADELFRVRGGLLLPDGGVVVANGGSQELLYFGAHGDLVRRMGGEGQGPGEFENIFWIQGGEAGAVSVYDAGNLRIVRYDQAGAMVSSRNVRFEPDDQSSERAITGPGFAIGVTGDDRVLAVPSAVARFGGMEGPLPLRGELRSYGPDFADFTPLDSVRLRTWYEATQPEGPPIEQMLEAPIFVFSSYGSWVAYSDALAHRVVVLEGGRLSHIIVEDRARIPFHPDSLPTHMNHAADSLPAYRALRVDSNGRVWLQPPDGDNGLTEWRVVSRDGRLIDSVSLPTTTSVLDAADDRVLLLERDEFDVETVVVRRIQ